MLDSFAGFSFSARLIDVKMRLLFLIFWALCPLPAWAHHQRGAVHSDFSAIAKEADSARDANDLDRAIVLYKKALALKPAWKEGWWSLGTIEYDKDNYADAAHAFQKVQTLDAKAGTARVMLGLCEFELGEDANALKHIEEGRTLGITYDPQLLHVMLYHEGVLLQRAAKFQLALIQLRKLCADGAEEAVVVEELGMAALRIPGKPDFVSGSSGEQVVGAVGRAECLAAQKKFDEARQGYAQIQTDYPQYPNIHYAYGRLLLDQDDTQGAIAEFEQEIQNDPKHVYARLEIAAAKYQTDSQGGLPYAEQAVSLNPQLPLGHFLLGSLLLDVGNAQRAITELEIARKGYPNEPQVFFALGRAYAAVGRREEAARARAQFLHLSQNKNQDSELKVYSRPPSNRP